MTSPPQVAPDLNDIEFDDWVARWLPRAARPYARLCRLDRPIGTWLTLLPCLAALVAAAGGWPDWPRLIVFSVGALLMRGVGCTINDIFDRDIDKHVERTRYRPLTSGQLSLANALWFLLGQLILCALLLCFLNAPTRWLAVALLPIVAVYPLCKRFTYWPQAILGIGFNWGMLMAWTDTRHALPWPAIAMWIGAVLWQIGYDTIYAYVDVRDDSALGLYSTALKFQESGRVWVGAFYAITLALWIAAGGPLGLDLGWGYTALTLVLGVHLLWQWLRFDLQRPERNFMLFRSNLWVGVLLLAAALAGTLVR